MPREGRSAQSMKLCCGFSIGRAPACFGGLRRRQLVDLEAAMVCLGSRENRHVCSRPITAEGTGHKALAIDHEAARAGLERPSFRTRPRTQASTHGCCFWTPKSDGAPAITPLPPTRPPVFPPLHDISAGSPRYPLAAAAISASSPPSHRRRSQKSPGSGTTYGPTG